MSSITGGRLALAALAAVALAGLSCGDGARLAAGRITGTVWVSSPLRGAVVHAHEVGADGTLTEVAVSAPTTDSGAFALEVGTAYGTLVLTVDVEGAQYVEMASSEPVTLDANSVALAAVIPVFHPDQKLDGVVISPVTSLAYMLAKARLAKPGNETTLGEAAARAHDLLGYHFLDIDPIGTTPVDPTAVTMPVQTTEDVRYGLVLAALSQLAWQIADTSDLSVQAVNSAVLARKLAEDIGSAEALFDSNGHTVTIGACPRPPGCMGDACFATVCDLDANTPRADLAAALVAYLSLSTNRTGIGFEDVSTRVEAMRANTEPELFDSDMPPDGIDDEKPTLMIVTPLPDAVVDGDVAIEVTAMDNTRVADIIVEVDGQPGPPDTDPVGADDHYLGTLDTTALPDGDVTVKATATDSVGLTESAEITIRVNNQGAKTISGQCIKGPVRGGSVRAYRYDGGVKSTPIGDVATTSMTGTFVIENVDDYSGPVLLECSDGQYDEEAFAFTAAMSSGDVLRTVIPYFDQEQNYDGAVITPFTSLATTYLEFTTAGLTPLNQAALEAKWQNAYSAFKAYLGITGPTGLDKLAPAALGPGVNTLTDQSRYALALAALSQLAVRIAAQNGMVMPGATVNAIRVFARLDADLADGCFDGVGSGLPLNLVGVPLGDQTARYELAEAVAAFMRSPFNPSGLDDPAAAIDFLDHLSLWGSAGQPGPFGSCATGTIWPTAGGLFDREDPVVVFDAPAIDNQPVRGTVMLQAHGTDNLTASPVTTWIDPPGLPDTDGQPANAVVLASLNTSVLADGPFTVKAQAVDGAGRTGVAARTLLVDNTGPTVMITSPLDGAITKNAMMTVTGTATDATSGVTSVQVSVGATTVMATLMGASGPGTRTWTANVSLADAACGAGWTGTNTIRARATDAAMNQGLEQMRMVTLDRCAPTVDVQPNTMLDEFEFKAGFNAQHFPCLGSPMGAMPITLDYEVNASSGAAGPTVYKYAVNTSAAGATCAVGATLPMGTNVAGANPITWLVSVQDNFSPGGVTLSAVVTDPSGGTAVVTPVALGGGMFSIALHAGNVPALATMDGTYQIALTATDQAGNQRTAPGSAMAPFQPIRFTLRVLGGPLKMESQPITAPPMGSGYVLTAGRTLQANNVAAVFAAGPKKVVVGKLRVYNGTTTPTFVIAQSTALADFKRILYDVNVQFQSLDAEGPFCNPNAFSPPTTTGTCLASVPTDSRPANATPMNGVNLITDMLAFTSTNVAATPCSGMGCGASQFEWLVPGASGGVAGFIDVYLLADGFSAMWDGSVSSVGQALGDNTITVAGAGTWSLFGFRVFDWGQNDMFNPIIIRKSRIKYLKRFEVFANESIDEVGFQVELGAANAAWMPDAVAPIDLDFSWIIDEMTGGP